MRELIISDTHNYDYYSSISEVLDVPISNPLNRAHYHYYTVERSQDSGWSSNVKWYGVGEGWPLVEKYITEGWAEGLAKMKQLAEEVERKVDIPFAEELRPRIVHRDFGDEVDMQDIYMGDYDHAWSGVERTTVKTDMRFTVAIDIGSINTEHSSSLYWPGAVATVLTNMLVEAGQPVRVLVIENVKDAYIKPSTSGLNDFGYAIELKSFNRPILPDAIALVALAGFSRTVGFKAVLNQLDDVRKGIGVCTNALVAMEKALKLSEQDHVLYIRRVRSEYDAINELKRKLHDIENFVGVR